MRKIFAAAAALLALTFLPAVVRANPRCRACSVQSSVSVSSGISSSAFFSSQIRTGFFPTTTFVRTVTPVTTQVLETVVDDQALALAAQLRAKADAIAASAVTTRVRTVTTNVESLQRVDFLTTSAFVDSALIVADSFNPFVNVRVFSNARVRQGFLERFRARRANKQTIITKTKVRTGVR